MIKIKDYIFNENEIIYIEEFDAQSLGIMFKGKDKAIFVDAHTEDIEWNYEDKQIRKCLESIGREEELEEKNKKLNELIEFNVQTSVNLTKINNQLEDIINKAIEYIKTNTYSVYDKKTTIYEDVVLVDKLLKILKGEEND